MTVRKYNLKPGIVTELTALTAQQNYVDGNCIRFRNGQAQQIGYWLPYDTNQITLDGIARALNAWEVVSGDILLAIGTNRHIYLVDNGQYYDITPYRIGTNYLPDDPFTTLMSNTTVTVFAPAHGMTSGAIIQFITTYVVNGSTIAAGTYTISVVDANDFTITATSASSSGTGGGSGVFYNTILPNNPFTTINGSNVVSVYSPNHGLTTGDIAFFPNLVTFNGVSIQNYYSVTVTDYNDYTITLSTQATASSSGGGSTVVFDYLIPSTAQDQSNSYGWGTGDFSGNFGWSNPSGGTGIPGNIGYWFFQNFGQDLIAQQFNGAIYLWSPGNDNIPAQIIYEAPYQVGQVVVTPSEYVIAYGSSTPGSAASYDPKLIQWCSQGDYTDWTPNETNSAGAARINTGSTIMTTIPMMLNYLILTDVDAYWQQPLSTAQPAFGFQLIASNCGCISKRAAVSIAGTAFWMSSNQFFSCTAGVQPIPCLVQEHVFGNLNYGQSEKIYACSNTEWNEIFWYYPSANSIEIDSYVKYNYFENLWDYGSLLLTGNSAFPGTNYLLSNRTAWIDVSAASPDHPISVDSNGTLWYQECVNITTGQNPQMPSYIVSGWQDISEGDQMTLCRRFIPDFQWDRTTSNPMIQITFEGKPFVGASEVYTKGPYTISSTTDRQDFFIRGRQINFQVNGLNGFWKIGTLSLDIMPHGKR